MAKTLFILNDAPYGTERSYNAVPSGYYNIEVMLRTVGRHGGDIGVCGTCMDARGIAETELAETTHRSSLEELTNWVQWTGHALVFSSAAQDHSHDEERVENPPTWLAFRHKTGTARNAAPASS
jgi:uncharacterized protein involved in oxidation of intracellular sulfur